MRSEEGAADRVAPAGTAEDRERAASISPANALLEAALAYAALGWPVLPLRTRSKLPQTDHAFNDASDDPAVIQGWWQRWPMANVGIAMAPAGLAAIDIDPRNGGSLEALPERLDTLTARSGSGGWHLIVQAPEIAEFRGKLGRGIDIKWRGYLVVEPSIHPNGKRYYWDDWEVGLPLPPIAQAPAWMLRGEQSAHIGTVADPHRAAADPQPSDRLDIVAAIRAILKGETYHDNLIRLASHYIATGMRQGDVVDLLRGTMMAVENRSDPDRWRRRYDAIPTVVASAVAKFAPSAAPASEPPRYAAFATLDSDPPPPRRWIIENWIPRGHVTAFFAAGGVGKSLLVQQFATHVTLGILAFGVAVQPGPTLAWLCEDDDAEVRRRQRDILAALERMPIDSGTGMHFAGRAGIESVLVYFDRERRPLFTGAYEQLVAEIERIRPVLVVLDNVAQVFGGLEIDRGQATMFLNVLTGIARRFDLAVLLVGHIAKAQGSEYSGSTAWEAAVRSRLWLERHEDGTVSLHKRKANYADRGTLTLEWRAGAFAPAAPGTPDTAVMREAEATVLAGLDVLTARQIATSQSRFAANFLPKLLEREGLLNGTPLPLACKSLGSMLDRHLIVPNAVLGWRRSDRHDATGLARQGLS